MSYLPVTAWSTVINDVVMLTTTTYRVTISPLNPNEPGGDVADVAVGYYLKDFVGNVYDITGINVGGNPTRIEVTDPTDIPSGYGPQTGQVAFIYTSPQTNEAPYLAPVRNKRLDQSALDYSRSIEMDIAWKHRGFRENTSNHDNITTIAIGSGITSSVEHDTGWAGGNKLSISVPTSDNYEYWKLTDSLKVPVYGNLYNIYVKDDARGICPTGWHIATDTEWGAMGTALGGNSVAGGKMKEAGTVYWGTGGTNTSGFNGRGSGFRRNSGGDIPGGFEDLKSSAIYWQDGADDVATLSTANDVLVSNGSGFGVDGGGSSFGFLIRLVKDDSTDPGTVTDYDGNIYPTVKIGTVVIMAADLIVEHFNNGDPIVNITVDATWVAATTSAMCYFDNDRDNAWIFLTPELLVHSHDLVRFKDTDTVSWQTTELSPEEIVLEATITPGVFPALSKRSYTVLLSQTGTNAPVESVVLINEIGAIVWTRVSAGTYRATLSGAFVADHTVPIDDIMMDQLWNLYTLNRISANVMELKTYAAADITVLADDVLVSRYINFEVFV